MQTTGEAERSPMTSPPGNPIAREFWREQVPLVAGALLLGLITAYLQHGFVPGADRAFPVAEVRVPIWHIIWMGAWTGYTMAVVGEAAGIFALPYSMTILQFSNAHVTPSTQLLTFLNPFGALLGFRRSGQWNLKFASAVCLGGAVGGFVGPFLRSTLLAAAGPFKLTLGFALAVAGVHLCYAAFHRKGAPSSATDAAVPVPSRGKVSIEARIKGWHIIVAFRGQQWRISMVMLFTAGALIGTLASALGVGGGFLLVPLLASVYKLPMYVLVAATIPFVIVLSAVGLFTYSVILPALGSPPISPEWAWGFFAAAGGIFGSWAASKTQMYVPEHFLKLMLGGVTGIVGTLYIVNFFYPLPFRL
jgi:uncharacterized membrane protein YfcA